MRLIVEKLRASCTVCSENVRVISVALQTKQLDWKNVSQNINDQSEPLEKGHVCLRARSAADRAIQSYGSMAAPFN